MPAPLKPEPTMDDRRLPWMTAACRLRARACAHSHRSLDQCADDLRVLLLLLHPPPHPPPPSILTESPATVDVSGVAQCECFMDPMHRLQLHTSWLNVNVVSPHPFAMLAC